MFSIGERIIYGSEGVFTVAEYAKSPIDKHDLRQFYVLKPYFGPEGNMIYTPVDNAQVRMRATMTREEAVAFLETVAEIGQVEVERERSRRDRYRETMLSATAAEYVSIIKTVRCRRQEFLRLKKRLPDSDTDYEKKARFCLYGELASALGISMAEAETMILERLS